MRSVQDTCKKETLKENNAERFRWAVDGKDGGGEEGKEGKRERERERERERRGVVVGKKKLIFDKSDNTREKRPPQVIVTELLQVA